MSHDKARKIRLIMGLRRGGITDARVLGALERVPRELFVDPAFLDQARALTWPGHRLTELPKAHHFNVIDFLEDPDHPLTGWLTNEGAEPPNEPNPSV